MAQVPEDDRLARLEQVIARQQEQITRQQEHMARLEASLAQIAPAPAATEPSATEPAEAELVAPARGERQRDRVAHGGTSSRRTLLKLGGAAAVGVAAAAAGASDLAHPGTARATGVPWQTGVVNSDNQTFVEPSNGSFPDPTLLAVRVGTTTPYQGLSVANSAAIAAYETTGSAVGVYASSAGSKGVVAVTDVGIGVEGSAASTGIGVSGVSDSGTGVFGNATAGGPGVRGSSISGYGGSFGGGKAPLFLEPSVSAGAPSTPSDHSGELYLDSNNVLWLCTAPGVPSHGIPGSWVRLASVPNGITGGTIAYLSTPVRLLDARNGASSGLVNRGPLGGNEVYTFGVAGLGGSGIPSSAQGLIANVTILGPSAVGNLSLFPAGGAIPTVASMTFGSPGLFLANGVNVAIGSGGAINIQNQSNGTTPLVLDAVAFVC
jgi:hypothetical protein